MSQNLSSAAVVIGTLRDNNNSSKQTTTLRRRSPQGNYPLRACEPVPEVETDVADSGAQLGSVSDTWLVMFNGELAIISK